MPDRFLRKVTADLGFTLPPAGRYGAGLVFLPRSRPEREQLRRLIEQTVRSEGHDVSA
jgi:glutamate synthase domain-containing protein 1